MKKGQIAHIDRDSTNNTLSNLAYLCLEHHEEYDSRSRQAKGLTPDELRNYRDELHSSIQVEWSKPAPFALPPLDPLAAIAGHYVFQGPNMSAELQLAHLGNGIVQVSGLAISGIATPTSSAHTGSVDFVSDLRNDRLYFTDRAGDRWYNLELTVSDGTITAIESSNSGYHGMNVSFAGSYRRV
jgi:hypothetical protein